ncbi:MAG: zinc finger AN1 domain-containing stress-associated protein [Methanocella sp.]
MSAKDRSVGCEVCGKELLLYKCKFCGKAFCEAHKAPEKHECQGLAEYRRQKESGTMVKPGVSDISDGEDTRGRPSALRVAVNRGALAVKLLSVLAVIAACIIAFILLLSYVDINTPTYTVSIPVSNATGAAVALVNYKNATDPTCDQLADFLKADKTIETRYSYPNFTCADFARKVHDNAEASGIRCGFVAIDFYDTAIDYSVYDNGNGKFSAPVRSSDVGHGIDVFNTSDRGLVFVDASSQSDYAGENPEVRIDYLEKGKELNGIDIEWATNTSYSFYESYKKDHLNLIYDQRKYYDDRNALDAQIQANGGPTYEMRLKNDQLNSLAMDLNLRESRLGPLYYPQGIVKDYTIYW